MIVRREKIARKLNLSAKHLLRLLGMLPCDLAWLKGQNPGVEFRDVGLVRRWESITTHPGELQVDSTISAVMH